MKKLMIVAFLALAVFVLVVGAEEEARIVRFWFEPYGPSALYLMVQVEGVSGVETLEVETLNGYHLSRYANPSGQFPDCPIVFDNCSQVVWQEVEDEGDPDDFCGRIPGRHCVLIFNDPDTVVAEVHLSDGSGVLDTDTATWGTPAMPVPIEGLVADNDSPTRLGSTTTLTATITAGSNVSYTWVFGDGDTASGAVVTHTYPTTGSYTAVVTASNPVSVLTATTPATITDNDVGDSHKVYLPLLCK